MPPPPSDKQGSPRKHRDKTKNGRHSNDASVSPTKSGRSKKPSAGKWTEADSVKVAVRVRPFNQRELDAHAKLCVTMQDKMTTVIDTKGNKPDKSFTYDYSYWSHDGFTTDADGLFHATDDKYCTQQQVYDDLGQGLLDSAMQGYNGALFAYGQTGAGKSYSMTGYGPNKGIIPILCQKVFDATSQVDASTEFQVTFSMYEIYNERVRDLLSNRPVVGGLKVRQHPKHGFIVSGLHKIAVSSYDQVAERMEAGTIARTTASTRMNETSSRSHMVITVHLKQVLNKGTADSTTKTSDLHLVDLAGSERAETSGTTGDRQQMREGSSINQSLTYLGKVIKALASIADGKSNIIVPYRESVLTQLLQNALGGNSRTVMIAAISPASICYNDTLSTLRYADNAKQIQCKAVVNESPTDRLIRELKEENARLIAQLEGGAGVIPGMEDALEANQNDLAQLEMTWEERLKEAEKHWKADVGATMSSKRSDGAHLENINEDPQLSGVIIHPIEEGRSLVTRNKDATTQDPPRGIKHFIVMGGLSIQSHHAVFSRHGNRITLTPNEDGTAQVLVNGKRLLKKTTLVHNDRIVMAPNHLYRFVACPEDRVPSDLVIDFDFMQTEIAAAQGLTSLTEGTSTSLMRPDQQVLREDVIFLLPMISEANAISEELSKHIEFDLVVRTGASHNLTDKSKQVMIKVTNTKSKHVWMWSKPKFINRKFLMQELYERWVDGEHIDPDKHRDPFWDPAEDVFLGSAYLYLQSLAYHIDVDENLDITNYQGQIEGKLHAGLCPCDSTGKALTEDMFISDPTELLGNRMDLLVKINGASDLAWMKEDPTRGVSCRFKFYTDVKFRQTRTIQHDMEPKFNFSKQFTIKQVSHNFMNYLEHNALVIELWGKQGTGQQFVAEQPTNGDEAEMDQIVAAANWKEERQLFLSKIEELQAELDYAQIEKMALEKDLTRITLKTGDTFMQPKKDAGMAEGVDVLIQEFMNEDQILRERMDELTSRSEKPEKPEITSIKHACDLQAKRIDRISKELRTMVDTPRKVIAELSKKK
eukprot:m.30478 g.30478  ORF g.30478 m.30478 type:complete len:1046 (+) comp4713_c0_seq1:156-3293(+)